MIDFPLTGKVKNVMEFSSAVLLFIFEPLTGNKRKENNKIQKLTELTICCVQQSLNDFR